MSAQPARRRYNRTVLLLSLVYVASLFGAIGLFNAGRPHGIFAYAVAVLPALPIVGMFAALGRYLVEERDEYLRMLLVRQSLWATGFALTLATIWGFLENFDLVEHVDAYYLAVLWFGGLGVGSLVNRLTVGADGRC